jgi:hypothetical protein
MTLIASQFTDLRGFAFMAKCFYGEMLLLLKENPRKSVNGKAVRVIRVPMLPIKVFGLVQKKIRVK